MLGIGIFHSMKKEVMIGEEGAERQHLTGNRQNKSRFLAAFRKMAEWTGLEPATPCVTGRYSNQLNYHSAVVDATGLEPVTLAL